MGNRIVPLPTPSRRGRAHGRLPSRWRAQRHDPRGQHPGDRHGGSRDGMGRRGRPEVWALGTLALVGRGPVGRTHPHLDAPLPRLGPLYIPVPGLQPQVLPGERAQIALDVHRIEGHDVARHRDIPMRRWLLACSRFPCDGVNVGGDPGGDNSDGAGRRQNRRRVQRVGGHAHRRRGIEAAQVADTRIANTQEHLPAASTARYHVSVSFNITQMDPFP